MSTQTGQTNVTYGELVEAQGGCGTVVDNTRLTVECPAEYDLAEITAEDIVNDEQIVVV